MEWSEGIVYGYICRGEKTLYTQSSNPGDRLTGILSNRGNMKYLEISKHICMGINKENVKITHVNHKKQ